MRLLTVSLLSFSLFSAHLFGAAVTPACQSFGTLAGATFGGSGLNGNVCYASFSDGPLTVTIGLTATPRVPPAAPLPVTNDGNGTYTAYAGPGTAPNLAVWNIGLFSNVTGGPSTNQYVLNLLFDINPALATDETAHGSSIWFIDDDPATSSSFGGLLGTNLVEGSQNMGFNFWTVSSPPFLTPQGGTFDPTAIGEYTFRLSVARVGAPNVALGNVSMMVNTVPEPGTYALLGVGVGIIGLLRRRRR